MLDGVPTYVLAGAIEKTPSPLNVLSDTPIFIKSSRMTEKVFLVVCGCTKLTLPFVPFPSPPRRAATLAYIIFAAVLKCTEGWIRVTTKTYPGQPGSAAWPVTIVSAMGGAYTWALVFPTILEQVLEVMIKSSSVGGAEGKKVAEKMETMHSLMQKQRPIAVVAFSMIICTKLTEDPFVQRWFIVGYFLGCSVISVFFVFFIGIPAIAAFEETIRESMGDNPSPKMKGLHGKIVVLLREIRNNGYSNTGSAVVFGVCPFLWSVAPYQNAFGWTMGIIIYTVGIIFLTPNAKKAAKVAAAPPTETSEEDEK